RLLQREREISEALRELISASTSLMADDDDDDDDDEDDDDEEDHPSKPVAPPPDDADADDDDGQAAAGSDAADANVRVGDRSVRKGDDIRGESVEVASGSVASSKALEGVGPNSRTEDKVTRRRKGRARARTNQFRITLEARMGSEEPHAFFSYRDDGVDDLPGLFIATPNLLKVGREVRVRATLDKTLLEATGVVAWRRQRGEEGGPPGMGIELLNLNKKEQSAIEKWVKKHPPQLV
ncbi:MAG: Tfp pilus assembly protein PilZ, partial [Myxococcota bacterium]